MTTSARVPWPAKAYGDISIKPISLLLTTSEAPIDRDYSLTAALTSGGRFRARAAACGADILRMGASAPAVIAATKKHSQTPIPGLPELSPAQGSNDSTGAFD
jgi:hypothetical protein